MAKTLKVRIPAVVSADGKWAASGHPSSADDPDWGFLEDVADNGGPLTSYSRMWITAELPIPEEAVEIEAAAVEAHQ